MTYTVEFDTCDLGYFCGWYDGAVVESIFGDVARELEANGGGHADIYDEDGEFITDLEV